MYKIKLTAKNASGKHAQFLTGHFAEHASLSFTRRSFNGPREWWVFRWQLGILEHRL
jgi:hypothetical protein